MELVGCSIRSGASRSREEGCTESRDVSGIGCRESRRVREALRKTLSDGGAVDGRLRLVEGVLTEWEGAEDFAAAERGGRDDSPCGEGRVAVSGRGRWEVSALTEGAFELEDSFLVALRRRRGSEGDCDGFVSASIRRRRRSARCDGVAVDGLLRRL